MNLSESSIEQQFQLAVEISDRPAVSRITTWFDETWESDQATCLDAKSVKRLAKLKPIRPGIQFKSRPKAKLPKWKGQPPELPLAPSDFKISATAVEIKRLLQQFRSNVCGYHNSGGGSCSKWSKETEKYYETLGDELRSLMARKASWGTKQLARIFEIAHANGKAAMMLKPVFVRHQPAKVAKSLQFLLQGAGDPYIRFEKVLASGSGYKLAGMGASGLKFLMHLWEPKVFAVVNAPILSALKKLKVRFPSSHRQGQVFKDQTAAVRRIAELTKLGTFARVDHFLDGLGKDHIG